MDPSERHNRLAPELLTRIIRETEGEAEAMVVLESVVMGVLLYYCPKPREAAVFRETLTEAVVERMANAAR